MLTRRITGPPLPDERRVAMIHTSSTAFRAVVDYYGTRPENSTGVGRGLQNHYSLQAGEGRKHLWCVQLALRPPSLRHSYFQSDALPQMERREALAKRKSSSVHGKRS